VLPTCLPIETSLVYFGRSYITCVRGRYTLFTDVQYTFAMRSQSHCECTVALSSTEGFYRLVQRVNNDDRMFCDLWRIKRMLHKRKDGIFVCNERRSARATIIFNSSAFCVYVCESGLNWIKLLFKPILGLSLLLLVCYLLKEIYFFIKNKRHDIFN